MWRRLFSLPSNPENDEKEKKRQINKEIKEKKLHLKKIRRELREYREEKFRKRMVNLKARVERVNIDGLGWTKDHVVTERVKKLFKVECFQDIIETTKLVQRELKTLGCFKTVNIYVDTITSEELDKLYEVNIKVEEIGRVFMNLGVVNGRQDSEVGLVVRGGLNNLRGRGERLEVEACRGSENSRESVVSLVTPLHSLPKGSRAYFSLAQSKYRLPNMPINQGIAGVSLGSDLKFSKATFTSKVGLDCLDTSVDWTALSNKQKCRWHPVLEHSGSSLLGNISTSLNLDLTDSFLMPSHGIRGQISHTTGVAPWSCSLLFQQIKVGLSAFYPIFKSVSLGLAAFVSHTTSPSSLQTKPKVPLLYMSETRSPMVFRGASTPPDYSGDLTAAVYKASITSKLPLLTPNSLLCKHTRFHTFITGHAFRNSSQSTGLSASNFLHFFGLGVVGVVSDIGRFELNYTLPLNSPGRPGPGLSFAFGTEFL